MKAGEWFRLVRLDMVSPVPRHHRRCQAETPLIPLSRFPKPALFDEGRYDRTAVEAINQLTGIALPKVLEAFDDLKGSFLRRPAPGGSIWGFAHPTIADALTEILRQKPHMVPALLRGATIDTILGGFVCDGAGALPDAMVVPSALNAQLVARLIATPDEQYRNWSLFSFMSYRASDEVLRQVLVADASLLERHAWGTQHIHDDPRINVLTRAHRLGLLPAHLRDEAACCLDTAARDFDMGFFDDEDILALVPPARLLALGLKVRGQTLPTLEDKIAEVTDEADLDEDPSDQFHGLRTSLGYLADLVGDDDAGEIIATAKRQIDEAVQILTDQIEERDRARRENVDTDWEAVLDTVAESVDLVSAAEAASRPRSIFNDVDQS